VSRDINFLARFAIERRVTLWMAILGLFVLGWMSLSRLPLEFLPTFSSSSISVTATYPSASPDEVERLVVQPLEDSLGTINGIDTMSASAQTNSGTVRLQFVDGTDMDLAAVEVRDRLDRVRHLLPEEVDRISIRRFQSSDIPVVNFHLTADWPSEQLFDFTENVVQRRIERLEGVAEVTVTGLRTPKVLVAVDPARLRAHRVQMRTLVRRLRLDNQDITVGDVEEGSREVLVRSLGEFRSLQELRELPIDDSGLRLEDVADVAYRFPKQERFDFLNGGEALTVRVNKVSTANLLDVVDRVKVEMTDIAASEDAAGLGWRVYHDASLDVREGLTQLTEAGVFGGGLAVLAVFLFLRRLRTTFLIAIAIPVSVVGTFVIIYFLRITGISEITLNVVSLAGLMLALGMLVDNSIVVIESIFRHRNELGEDARTAALLGTSEVALPITASTMTTLCVFLPLIFTSTDGWMQTYMENVATTVCTVMVSSLIVSLTVVPMVSVFLLENERARQPGWIHRMRGGYGRFLGFTLRHRFAFVLAIMALLYGSVQLFQSIERSFTQSTEERSVRVAVDTPRQYTLTQTSALYDEIYEMLDSRREELDIQDISYSYDRGSGKAKGGWRGARRFDIYLVDEADGSKTTAEVREAVRASLPSPPGVEVRIEQGRGHGSSTGIEVELIGDDSVVLERLSQQLVASLREIPVLKDVDTSLESGDEEIYVLPQADRVLQAGLSSRDIADTVNAALTNRPVSRFRTADREVDLVIQYREEDRETLDQLKQFPVFGNAAALPLDSLVDFEIVSGPQQIERENHRSKIKVTANTGGGRESFAAMGMVGSLMGGFTMPPGYSWSFGRWNRMQQKDQQIGTFALWFALLLIYMLMAALFESFGQPLIIMLSVPFALLGVAVVMKLAKVPLESMTTLGLLILVGVVVNNAIVLIDHINGLRAEGVGRNEAIILGGQNRLRPILITAVTTILGLLPLVGPILLPDLFGPVEGRAGTWAPIGLVIMGGLTTSTFLTLIIIPTIYSLIDDFTNFLKRVAASV